MKKLLMMFVVLLLSVNVCFADDSGLAVGVMAPEIEGRTYSGDNFKLSEAYGEEPVVLIFYRGAWCPYCNVQLQRIESRIEEFEDMGVQVVAVSIDTVEKNMALVEGKSVGIDLGKKSNNPDIDEVSLTFDVVGEISIDTLKAWNAVQHIDAATNEKYLQWGIDLEDHAGGATHHVIAIPATYIIGTDGEIIFAESNRDYKTRTKTGDIIAFLESF